MYVKLFIDPVTIPISVRLIIHTRIQYVEINYHIIVYMHVVNRFYTINFLIIYVYIYIYISVYGYNFHTLFTVIVISSYDLSYIAVSKQLSWATRRTTARTTECKSVFILFIVVTNHFGSRSQKRSALLRSRQKVVRPFSFRCVKA